MWSFSGGKALGRLLRKEVGDKDARETLEALFARLELLNIRYGLKVELNKPPASRDARVAVNALRINVALVQRAASALDYSLNGAETRTVGKMRADAEADWALIRDRRDDPEGRTRREVERNMAYDAETLTRYGVFLAERRRS